MSLSAKTTRILAAIVFLVAASVVIGLLVIWRTYAPGLMSGGTSDRFFAPATTVSASLLIALSVSGATVLSRFDVKRLLGELSFYILGFLSLLIGLFMSVWGLVAGSMDQGTTLGFVIAIPTTWLLGSLLLLGAMLVPFYFVKD